MRLPRIIVAAVAAAALLVVGVHPALAHPGGGATRVAEQIAVGGYAKPKQRGVKVRFAQPKLLKAAAELLGMTKTELREALADASLAELAEAQDAAVDDLKSAMLAAATEKLANAVETGRITQAQADTKLERHAALVDRLIATEFPAG